MIFEPPRLPYQTISHLFSNVSPTERNPGDRSQDSARANWRENSAKVSNLAEAPLLHAIRCVLVFEKSVTKQLLCFRSYRSDSEDYVPL